MRRQPVVDEEAELVLAVDAAVCGAFRDLRRTIQKNLALLTVAFLRVVGAARSGHGRLSLASLFRVLPTPGTAHSREKRLHRFLANQRLDPRAVTEGLAQLIFGKRGPSAGTDGVGSADGRPRHSIPGRRAHRGAGRMKRRGPRPFACLPALNGGNLLGVTSPPRGSSPCGSTPCRSRPGSGGPWMGL